MPTVPTLTMEILDEDGVKLGYIIKYGSATPINLRISDVLPITSFEYIPESILQGWGERVIVFHKDSYKPVEIKMMQLLHLQNKLFAESSSTSIPCKSFFCYTRTNY